MKNDWANLSSQIMPILGRLTEGAVVAMETNANHHTTQILLGNELRRLRIKRGLSLRRMASVLKISAPHLSDMERGNRNWTFVRAEQFLAVLTNPKIK